MTVWEILKEENIKLTGFKDKSVTTLLKTISQEEIDSILADLEKETVENQRLAKGVELAFKIAKIVLEKGIDLAL